MTLAVVAVIGCYALGCLTAGYYLVRLRAGTDVRAAGTGSTGARNVGRTAGLRLVGSERRWGTADVALRGVFVPDSLVATVGQALSPGQQLASRALEQSGGIVVVVHPLRDRLQCLLKAWHPF